jgi:hypothetical protein
MFGQKFCVSLALFAAIILPPSLAWAMGEQLGETKEQLKLKYDVSVTDHGTGRVTVTLTIADQGRLKPLTSVDLVIETEEAYKASKAGRGYSGYVDLSVALATREEDGKQVVRVHLLRELAERAQIQLKTSTLDGKSEPLTWYYHIIPIAKYLKNGEQKKESSS